jgi:SAM-dependent methyltransferase
MKPLDRVIQWLRIREAARWLAPGMRVLDIGCADGALYRQVPGLADYVGLDPALPERVATQHNCQLVRGYFPDALPERPPFDAITLLAVIEHLDAAALDALASGCAARLRPGGRVIVTVPAPVVDRILDLPIFLRLADGMAAEEHHGFDVTTAPAPFERAGLACVAHRRFELGLNHLFVFEKRATRATR